MTKRLTTKLMILATALLLVWVGISCKNKQPTEGDFGGLIVPDDITNTIGGTDGMLDDTSGYDDEMLSIRQIANSSDGIAYYRSPVVVTYNGGKGFAMFMEKRYGQGGVDDVGVDGTARVDIIYYANDRGGNALKYGEGDDIIVGKNSARNDKTYSKASPVVFVDGNEITLVAASGSGAMPKSADNTLESEVKIIKGTAGADSISFNDDWADLNIEFTPTSGQKLTGSAAIKKYVEEKINKDGKSYNSLYTRWGQGKMDGQHWLLPLTLIQKDGTRNVTQGVLVLYSEDKGANWKFGPYYNFDQQSYKIATGLSVNGTTVKLAAVPSYANSGHRRIGIYEGALSDNSTTAKELTTTGQQSSFQDSENNFEYHKGSGKDTTIYFINTRERRGDTWNGFQINQMLTLAIVDENLQEQQSMVISKACGIGSVVVLYDGTIVTVAEEAFAEESKAGENRFNVVQRRFTKGYMQKRDKIRQDDEYYNEALGSLGGAN